MKKIFCSCLTILFALTLALPVGVVLNTNKAFATGGQFVVLPTDINDVYISSNVVGDNPTLSSYTPYTGNEERMEGSALVFDGTVTIAFEPESDVTIHNQSAKSVYMYLFLPDTNISKITIRLQSSDSDSDSNPDYAITWVIESADLYAEIEKPISSLLVPGWRLIELPFVAGTPTIDGVQSDPVYLSALNYLYVNAINNNATEQRVGLYGAYIDTTSEVSDGQYFLYDSTVESYTFIETLDYYNNFSTNKLLNDKITIPAFSMIFDFAWIGGQKLETETGSLEAGFVYVNDLGNITTTTDAIDYRFALKVVSPLDVKYYSLNTLTEDTFSQKGIYTLQLVLQAEISPNVWKDVVEALPVSVKIAENVNVIWFDTTNNVVNIGYTYKIYFSVNTVYWRTTAEELEFISSNDKVLQIVNTSYDESGNGYVEVKALKKGKATISASSEFTRTNGYGKSVFDAETTISVHSDDEGSNKVIMIVLLCVFGAGMAGVIAYGIYVIVKHNKMQIK